jgi:hypothetical protein
MAKEQIRTLCVSYKEGSDCKMQTADVLWRVPVPQVTRLREVPGVASGGKTRPSGRSAAIRAGTCTKSANGKRSRCSRGTGVRSWASAGIAKKAWYTWTHEAYWISKKFQNQRTLIHIEKKAGSGSRSALKHMWIHNTAKKQKILALILGTKTPTFCKKCKIPHVSLKVLYNEKGGWGMSGINR